MWNGTCVGRTITIRATPTACRCRYCQSCSPHFCVRERAAMYGIVTFIMMMASIKWRPDYFQDPIETNIKLGVCVFLYLLIYPRLVTKPLKRMRRSLNSSVRCFGEGFLHTCFVIVYVAMYDAINNSFRMTAYAIAIYVAKIQPVRVVH